MEENAKSVFRKETIERISSPEQLTDYLNVTNPGIWIILAAVILFLAGMMAWASIGTLEAKEEVSVVVASGSAQVIPKGAGSVEEGMPLLIGEEETSIMEVETDDYGRTTGLARTDLPDGTYDGSVLTERIHPLEFLLGNG